MARARSGSGYQRPRSDIEAALKVQIEHLEASCESYDGGRVSEAARIAAAVFIIVHDGGQRSLLSQLNLRAGLRFASFAALIEPGNLLVDQPLVIMHMNDKGLTNEPTLDRGHIQRHDLQFHKWWEQEQVFKTPAGLFLNRRRLVFSMRNQDGGGHVDSALSDDAYVAFSRSAPGWIGTSSTGQTFSAQPSPHLPTMRHLGFELLLTLKDAGIAN